MENIFLRISCIDKISFNHLVELLGPSHKNSFSTLIDILRDVILVPSRVFSLREPQIEVKVIKALIFRNLSCFLENILSDYLVLRSESSPQVEFELLSQKIELFVLKCSNFHSMLLTCLSYILSEQVKYQVNKWNKACTSWYRKIFSVIAVF